MKHLAEELSSIKMLAKAALVGLATLIEEDAYSTRRDLKAFKSNDSIDGKESPLARSDDQVNQTP